MADERNRAMLPEWTIIGFSGHRDVADTESAKKGIRAALDAVLARRAPAAAVSSVAPGGDTIFVAEVAERGIPFSVLLPFESDRFAKTVGAAQWGLAHALIEKAFAVEELPATDSDDDSYLECGVLTVDRSDVLITLWNGAGAKGVGGTADVVEYARALGRPMAIVDPVTGALTTERFDKLEQKSAATPPLDAGSHEAVLLQHQLMDKAATKQRPSFLRIILLHLAAEAFAVTPLILHWEGLLKNVYASIELSLLLIALLMAFRMKHVHHEWLKSRMAAELCRSFLALWHVHRRGAALPRLPVPGLASLYRSLSMAWYLDRRTVGDFTKARDDYLQQRVTAQIAYFEKNYRVVAPRFSRLRKLATLGTFAAILTGIVALVMSFQNYEGVSHSILELSTMLLPLVSAAILSLIVAEDYMRRAVRYHDMLAMLRETANRLQMTRTWAGFSRIAVETEEKLLQEVLEWHSISMFLREPH